MMVEIRSVVFVRRAPFGTPLGDSYRFVNDSPLIRAFRGTSPSRVRVFRFPEGDNRNSAANEADGSQKRGNNSLHLAHFLPSN
jgi:hypothetical protein